jgi:tape measure domain-containing protein
MPEIDPIVIKLMADTSRYRAELRAATALSSQSFNRIDRDVQRLERQFDRSSAAIGGSLRTLAGSFATAFSVREAVGLIDTYTRLQNSLKVAGLEGQALAEVQERLFAVAQKNGVELEAVGQLYSRAAQNQKELGASTSDLIALTSAVSASLRISGTSTAEASGALLQLGQALGSPRIQAEEFNSLLDTMQPLLREAAKNIEGTGGTLAGLTQRIKDTNGPGVSNVELFRAITAALADLEKQAAASQSTIGAAFTTLNNALTTYVGQAAEANGVTNALVEGIKLLAENLDDIIPALALIAGIGLGRLAIGAVAGSRALQVLAAYASIGTTNLAGTALAAQGAGAALLRAFGGPVGVALTALTVSLVVLRTEFDRATDASADYAASTERLGKIKKRTSELTDQLATATGRAREEAIANAKAQRAEAEAYLATARAAVAAARAKATAARQEVANAVSRSDPRTISGFAGGLAGVGGVGVPGINFGDVNNAGRQKARAENGLAKAIKLEREAQKELDAIDALIRSASVPAAPSIAKPTSASRSSASTGSSAAEIARRQADEISRLQQEELQARIALTEEAAERASLQRELLASEYQQRRAQIENDTDFTKDQKAAQLAYLDRLYGSSGQGAGGEINVKGGGLLDKGVLQEEERALRERELEILALRFQAAQDALQDAYTLASTDDERRKIAFDLVDLEFQYRDSVLERIKNSKDLSKAIRDAAEVEQEGLRANQPNKRNVAARQNQSPLDRYREELQDVDTALENLQVDSLRRLNSELANATKNALGLKGALGDIVGALIEIAIRQTLIAPLVGAGGGGGGGIFSAIGSLLGLVPGRASGGPVSAGRLYRVNEAAGAGGVELFQPAQNGNIVPLGQTRAAMGGGGGRQGPIEIRIYADEGGTFVPRVEGISANVAVTVVREASGALIEASTNEALRRAGRPRL